MTIGKNIHYIILHLMRKLAVALSALVLVQCSEPGGDLPSVPREPVAIESNILFNGNLSLYARPDRPGDDNIRREVIRHLGDLQGIGSREAIWTGYGSAKKVSYGGWFDFSYNDKVFYELKRAGMRYCLQMKVDAVVENPDDYGPLWEENLRWYVMLLGKRYGTAPLYYIPMNEPDNAGQRPAGVDALTMDQIIRVQRIVWETLKQVNPEIKVASSPLCTLEGYRDFTTSAREVLRNGITEYCDYFAFHKHNDVGDDAREPESLLWDVMTEAELEGHPRRPAVLNENGCYLLLNVDEGAWPDAPEKEARKFKAYWIGNDLIQMKALGLKYIVAYSLAGSFGGPDGHKGEYNIVNVDEPVGDGYRIYEQEYNAYKDLWNPYAHLLSAGINGSFETPNPDKSRGWVVSFRGRSFKGLNRAEPKEWDYVDIVQENALSGSLCLEMRPIDFVGTGLYDKKGITGNRCRRLVEGLVPGAYYRLSAWVRLDKEGEDEPRAVLRAMGFDPFGKTKAEAHIKYSESDGAYIRSEVRFIADNPWVVISLEHNGKGTAYWDDISLEEF